MNKKIDDFSFGKYENLKKLSYKPWKWTLRWSSSSSLERWQVPVKRKVQLFGWNSGYLFFAPETGENGIGGVIYLFLK